MSREVDIAERLGQIAGTLDGIKATQTLHGESLGRVESRMGKLEQKVAVHSVLGGGVAAGLVTLTVEYIKTSMMRS